MRLAQQYADAHGRNGLNCVDAQPCDQPLATFREKGLIPWTVRLNGLLRGPFDEGSVIILEGLEMGEMKRLGDSRSDLQLIAAEGVARSDRHSGIPDNP